MCVPVSGRVYWKRDSIGNPSDGLELPFPNIPSLLLYWTSSRHVKITMKLVYCRQNISTVRIYVNVEGLWGPTSPLLQHPVTRQPRNSFFPSSNIAMFRLSISLRARLTASSPAIISSCSAVILSTPSGLKTRRGLLSLLRRKWSTT